jgi:glycosyltransferase involved in cell wall biosynthesis
MAGPMPPAIGGMASVVQDLCASALRDRFAIEAFDTAKSTLPGRSLGAAVAARIALWRRWWVLLGTASPLIAHIHTCSGLSFFLDAMLLWIARIRGARVVLHIHGGNFDRFIESLDPVRRWIVRATARGAARVIVLSDSWHARLRPLLPGAQLRVLENAVPLPAVTTAARRGSPPLVLFLGGLYREKGLEELVRAFARLTNPARLALVGPEAEEGFAARIRSLATDLGIDEQIQLPGPARGADKDAWLAKASIFVLPSHVEGQPISILEAMAAAIPVVASRVGAIPTMIESGQSGFLVEPGDIDGLARAIDRLLGDAGLRDRIGRAGRTQCELRFGIDRAVRQLQDLYGEVGAARRAGAAT